MKELEFRKSRRCDTGSCVEVAVADKVHVRNSTDPTGPIVTFTKEEWRAFVAEIQSGSGWLEA